MMRHPRTVLAALVALALPVAPALAGGPTMMLGAAEESVRSPDLVTTKLRMGLLATSGFTSVRVTATWTPGLLAPAPAEQAELANVDSAAQLTGMRVVVLVRHAGPASTPLTDEARAQIAQFTAALLRSFPAFQDLIVGYEPNLARYWAPQFNADGTNAAAAGYLSLLATTYDIAKSVNTSIRVWGGAFAPSGTDVPGGAAESHAPGTFLQDLGAVYRASGRPLPIMDGLAYHPYAQTSAESPDVTHPDSTTISIADYDSLIAALATAFDGTPQPGSALPILYDEFGVESLLPAGKAKLYRGSKPAGVKTVPETTQAAYYTKALQLAFCHSNVVGLFVVRALDERALKDSQSGIRYVDGTPKSSYWAVRDSLRRARGGSISRCQGLVLDVQPSEVTFPSAQQFRKGMRAVTFRCSLDCAWELRARRATGTAAGVIRGYGRIDDRLTASFEGRRLGAAPVALVLTVVHPIHPASPVSQESGLLPLR